MDLAHVKVLEITGDARISFADGFWRVPSQAYPGKRYKVDPHPLNPHCECEAFQLTNLCKHVQAVRHLLERMIKGEPHPNAPDRPPRKTYKQDWASYNEAQTHEKDYLQELLADLCAAIPEPKQKQGRKPVPLCDAVYTAVFKVYTTLSSRRFMSDLREAQRRGHIKNVTCYNTMPRTLRDPETTPILHALIRQSSLPLRSIETTFAIDSSGFATSRFAKWYDQKYGITRETCEWVKTHLVCGTKTGIVTAVIIGDKHLGDCPQLPDLTKATAANFTVKEMTADKAYLSNDNLELIESLGATAYIPFKSNSLPGGTPLWDRMFYYFQLRREEFLTHYHQRSNVESVFSAVKRKFGDAVRSKTDTAMMNEVLCKIICHNLACVIQEWHELGINPRDWMPNWKPAVEPQDDEPQLLKLMRPNGEDGRDKMPAVETE